MIAQHREIHTVLGSITSVKRGYINHPVTKLYLGEHLPCLLDYHKYTVSEMSRRGWNGHQTDPSPGVLQEAALRANGNTCKDWFDHVYNVVPSHGEFSVDYDVHDLIERWTNENKLLRNDLAAQFVSGHALDCDSACCVSYANSLVAEWEDRACQQSENKDLRFKVKGNSSLRGKLEVIGV